ncbi:MAG: plasmid recombination protein (plasmid) [Candidatus Cardinium sp.]|nr:MAG: plasmid recombination protein [Candidatus Cardinium sp.]
MTGSHDRMKEIEANEKLFEGWKKANWDFACKEFGGEKILFDFLYIGMKGHHIFIV